MSARTRKTFKARIAPRIARSRSVKRVRFLVIAPLLAGDTRQKMAARVKVAIELHEPCPVKVRTLSDTDIVVDARPWI